MKYVMSDLYYTANNKINIFINLILFIGMFITLVSSLPLNVMLYESLLLVIILTLRLSRVNFRFDTETMIRIFIIVLSSYLWGIFGNVYYLKTITLVPNMTITIVTALLSFIISFRFFKKSRISDLELRLELMKNCHIYGIDWISLNISITDEMVVVAPFINNMLKFDNYKKRNNIKSDKQDIIKKCAKIITEKTVRNIGLKTKGVIVVYAENEKHCNCIA